MNVSEQYKLECDIREIKERVIPIIKEIGVMEDVVFEIRQLCKSHIIDMSAGDLATKIEKKLERLYLK